jgi:hypothetical protein
MWTPWIAGLVFSTTFRHKAIARFVRLEIYAQNINKLSHKSALLVMFVNSQGFRRLAAHAQPDIIV